MPHKEYILVIYISNRPYQIDKSNALELLLVKKESLEQSSPNSEYKILSPYSFYLEKKEADRTLAKRD